MIPGNHDVDRRAEADVRRLLKLARAGEESLAEVQPVRRGPQCAGWLRGQTGPYGSSRTATGRQARGAISAARLLSGARVWLGTNPLARGRDLSRRLNFGSDLVRFPGAADQSAVFA